MQRASLSFAVALVLLTPGCGTLLSILDAEQSGRFPSAFGGLQGHKELLDDAERTYVALLPFFIPDIVLSLALDLALLPLTGPPALVHAMSERDLAPTVVPALLPPPAPPPPPPPTPEELARAEAGRRSEGQRRARAQAAERRLDEALARGELLAPHDAGRRAALVRHRRESILHGEDAFLWLPEEPAQDAVFAHHLASLVSVAEAQPDGPQGLACAAHIDERAGRTWRAIERCDRLLDRDPTDGVAWTIRGWAWLREGQLDWAEADLLLGAALCSIDLNVAWAEAGLGRVAEARGDVGGALARYDAALPRLERTRDPGWCDASADVRARAERLRAR